MKNTAKYSLSFSRNFSFLRGLFLCRTLYMSLLACVTMIALCHSQWTTCTQKINLYVVGADGVLQAMMLSYGALKFSNHHLEFGMHPRDLHRDYFFRRINYGNDTHVNISVQVGDDNKAVLYVSLDRNNRPYYACDAGCLDPPESLRYCAFYGT